MMIPISPPTPKELQEAVWSLYKKWTLHSQHKRMELARHGREHERLIEVLQALYPQHSFLRFAGWTFPIISLGIAPSQRLDPESILGTLEEDRIAHVDGELDSAGGRYVEMLQLMGRPLRNLPTYCLAGLQQGGDLKLNCVIGRYLDALRSCDVLEWELLTDLHHLRSGDDIDTYLRKHLRLRQHVHRLCRFYDPVTHFAGRSAALSVSTLVLFNRGKDYAVIIGERSADAVAVHGDLYHVVPSGMFQPSVGQLRDEYSILHCVLREYLEELFSSSEAQSSPAAISHEFFYRDPNIQLLRRFLDSGEAALYLTGFVVNALNLRPEICTLLHIRTPEWYSIHKSGIAPAQRIELNEEFKKPEDKVAGRANVVPIDRILAFGIRPQNVVPPGAAAIALGLETATALRLRS
jgi:hypothetical protein